MKYVLQCSGCGKTFERKKPPTTKRGSFCSRACRRPDIVGQRFGRLEVLAFVRQDGCSRWQCRCDCGREPVMRITALRDGSTRSCGCIAHEALIARNTTHGERRRGATASEYEIWKAMIGRCERETDPGYANYGGRGIMVCARWRTSYEAFLTDMGRRPGPGRSLDRIDNDVGYVCGKCEECVGAMRPANCRWATRHMQARNKRNNKLVTWSGETRTLAEWCELTGLKYGTLLSRITNETWTMERAFTAPVRYAGSRSARVVP